MSLESQMESLAEAIIEEVETKEPALSGEYDTVILFKNGDVSIRVKMFLSSGYSWGVYKKGGMINSGGLEDSKDFTEVADKVVELYRSYMPRVELTYDPCDGEVCPDHYVDHYLVERVEKREDVRFGDWGMVFGLKKAVKEGEIPPDSFVIRRTNGPDLYFDADSDIEEMT